MTRETKIGLLVGLAFIIVIGILLSDYNRNENQAAALNAVATDVQKGTTTLHNGGSTETTIVLPPTPPAPVRPVPTREELRQPPEIVIGPGANPGTDRGPSANAGVDRGPLTPIPPSAPENATANNTNTNVPPGLPRGLQNLLGEHGNELAVAGAPGHSNTPANPGNNTNVVTVNGARQYVAIPGDTVSKLAGRFLGLNTKVNREAILAINPSLKQNPNNVIVGRTYMIPPKAGTTPTPAAPAAPAPPARTVAVAPTPAPETPHYFYVVKENDNLWKIASEQLGDGTAWAAIKEVNKDILKGSDAVRPNMRLRLPAKPVATIN